MTVKSSVHPLPPARIINAILLFAGPVAEYRLGTPPVALRELGTCRTAICDIAWNCAEHEVGWRLVERREELIRHIVGCNLRAFGCRRT
jgi:hypothetical protein